MSLNRARVYAHIKNDRLILDGMDAGTGWVGSTDVSDIDTNTNHREGTVSLSFDKDGTTEAFGTISKTLDTGNQKNLVDFLRGKMRFWINLSSLTNVANVQLIIGEDATDNYVYQVADSDLSTGWNEVTFNVDSPTSTGGAGAAWSSIGYIAIKVNFDAVGNTLTEILIDALSVISEPDVNVESINLSGSGLATATLQTTGNAILTTIDADTGSIATDASTIAGDTTSIDGKTPALGTAVMTGAVPVTLATDDAAVVSLALIDNAIVTEDEVFASGGGLMMAGVEIDDPTALAVMTEGDNGNLKGDLAGRLIQTAGTLGAGEDLTNNVTEVVITPLAVSTHAPNSDVSAALEASSVTKASAGVLYGIPSFSNTNAAARYLQFFNSATVPADTAVPVLEYLVAAESTMPPIVFPQGVYFSTGIAWANSSTNGAKTIGSADSLAWVLYK